MVIITNDPRYMSPTYVSFLLQFPLTPNGKLDRRAVAELPGWESDPATLQAVGPVEEPKEAPRNGLEMELVCGF